MYGSRVHPTAGPEAAEEAGTRSTAAGLTLLFVLTAAAVGAAAAGAPGAGAGLLLAGGARNAYASSRLASDEKTAYEAGKQGLLGLTQLGVGAWLAYVAASKRER